MARQESLRERTADWLISGNGGVSWISVARRIAESHNVPHRLLLTLMLQESQFYHGSSWERAWTEAFLVMQRVPLDRLRNKSMGVLSIKPGTAQQLLMKSYGLSVDFGEAAQIVARSKRLSMDLAAFMLSDLLKRGATEQAAFLAYAASKSSVDLAIANVDELLQGSLRFRRRLSDYFSHQPKVVELERF